MSARVHAVNHPELPPFTMPDRFRHDVTYFATPAGEQGAPEPLGHREYRIRRDDAEQIYDDGVIRIVSILDSDHRTELEITEEQERWLQWMLENGIQHVRIE